MILGKGSTTDTLTVEDVRQLIAQACHPLPLDGKRVLVIIPDATRTAPIALFFRLLYEQLGQRAAQLDCLIALGTHPPMSEEAIERLVGVSAQERADRFPKSRIFNHHWTQPEMLQPTGVISRQEAARLTGGLLVEEVPVDAQPFTL
jgi:nickel-dependent lactate racemase